MHLRARVCGISVAVLSAMLMWPIEVGDAAEDHRAPRAKRNLKAGFKADFKRPQRSRMRMTVNTAATDEDSRDELQAQLQALIDQFLENPDPNEIGSLIKDLMAIASQFQPNELPGDIGGPLNGLEDLWSQVNAFNGAEGDLYNEFSQVVGDFGEGESETPENADELIASLNEVLERFAAEFPDLVDALVERIEAAISQFGTDFPTLVEGLTDDINEVIQQFNDGSLQDVLNDPTALDPDNLDQWLDDALFGDLDDMNDKIGELIDQFTEEDLQLLLDGLLGEIEAAIQQFMEVDLPNALDQLFADIEAALAEWEQTEAFDAESSRDLAGQTLTVQVGDAQFAGVFDDRGRVNVEGLKARMSADAETLRLDIRGAELLNGLGLDAGASGRDLMIDVPITIEISEGEARSGYEVEGATSVALLLDQDIAFSTRQKAQRVAVGKN